MPPTLSPSTEALTERELLRDKKPVKDPRLPISSYNYMALRDRPRQKGVSVSAPTIIRWAKAPDASPLRRRNARAYSPEVMTTSIGAPTIGLVRAEAEQKA